MLATFVLGTTALLAMGYALVCSVIALRFTTAHRKAPVAPAEDTRTVHFASRHGNAPSLRGRPVLIIHSEGDRFIPAADGRALAAACGARL